MAIPDKAVTRGEQYLASMAGESVTLPDKPVTRTEKFLAKAAGQDVETPPPVTREEKYLDVIAQGGGGGGETVYTSSTGMLYTPKMTIVVGGDLSTGRMLSDTLSRYGNMPHLEELTLTGVMRHVSARSLNGNAEDLFASSKFPALRKLRIAPDEIRTDTGAVIDPTDTYYNAIRFNHYAFTGTNLSELEIGKAGGPYMAYGGYFRRDMPVPPGTGTTNIGSEIGMTLIVYVSEYSATGMFTNGVLAPNTTVICKDYRTGEVLTA